MAKLCLSHVCPLARTNPRDPQRSLSAAELAPLFSARPGLRFHALQPGARPADRQALVIVMARLVGWAAQAIEQQSSGISLLPALRYGT